MITSLPVAEPVCVGSKMMVSKSVCPGLRVAGKFSDDRVNPAPCTAADLTVTAAFPTDVSVTTCVVAWFSTTEPNEMVVASTLNWADAGLSCSEIDLDVFPLLAVSFTVCVVETAEAFAVKLAVDEVAGIVTEPGTATIALLLARATVTPPWGADPDSVTLHASEAVPEIVVVLQDKALTVGAELAPVPERLTVLVPALVESESWPLNEPALVGLK